jgi:hypothetical protein
LRVVQKQTSPVLVHYKKHQTCITYPIITKISTNT